MIYLKAYKIKEILHDGIVNNVHYDLKKRLAEYVMPTMKMAMHLEEMGENVLYAVENQ